MRFLKFQLNYQQPGTPVEVSITGSASDVFLVDNTNLAIFERGRGQRLTRYGGHYNASPVVLQVPSGGVWTAVVVPPPGRTVTASVRILART
jgi:hypothetical protein